MSLIEAVVATALTLVLIGTAVPLVNGSTAAAAVAPEIADEQQRARFAADAIARDLRAAGNGVSVGPNPGPLLSSFAPIIPRRFGMGGDAPNVARADVITIISAMPPSQSLLAHPITSINDVLQVTPAIGCPHGTQVCGLRQGSTAVLFDETGRFDVVGILGLAGSTATFEHRQTGVPSMTYQPGAVVTEAEQHTYYFDAANLQLREFDGAHSDVPLIDNVVSVRFEYFGDPNPPRFPKPPLGVANCLYDTAGSALGGMSILTPAGGSLAPLPLTIFTDGPWCGHGSNLFDADLLRIRLVRVMLRVQAGNPTLRGRGADFAIAGIARGARLVPDFTLHFDVAPRNMNPGR